MTAGAAAGAAAGAGAAASSGRYPVAQRPVVAGYHPDPSVCRVGEEYFLACSTFEYAPGVPIFRSRDLVDWTLVGHALHRADQLRLEDAGASAGVYAPTLRHHEGRFWMVTTNVSDGPGHLLVTAERPEGPWSEPVRFPETAGIDPDIAWDEQGRCFLTWAHGVIRQAEIDPSTGEVLTPERVVWEGTGGKSLEAPHLYRIGETWYLVTAEGGTDGGHAVMIARGPTPSGPFETCPDGPLLTRRGMPGHVQSTGHGDLVQRADGTWALLHLAVRSHGSFPGWHVLGRETFAARIEWSEGWPRVTGPLEPACTEPMVESAGRVPLPLTWVGDRVFPSDVVETAEDGWALRASGSGRAARTFVGRRQQHAACRVTARLSAPDLASRGALEIRIDERHSLGLEVTGASVRAVARVGDLAGELGGCDLREGDRLELRVTPVERQWRAPSGPDRIEAVVVRHGAEVLLGSMDGRYLSTEVAGGFTGRMVGVSCEAGAVHVAEWGYEGLAEG